MKARQVLLFILSVCLMLGAVWAVFPAEGVRIGGKRLRFASYQGHLRDLQERKLDLDSLLMAKQGRFKMQQDTLAYYREFFYEDPDRIYLPDDDYTFFDPVFQAFERARKEGKTVRVVHYGDSQIELDRISSNLRDALQERFGGEGTGMFPALTRTPMASISHSAAGGMTGFPMVGDSLTRRAGHNRYGPLSQVVSVQGSGTVSLRALRQKSTLERVRHFSSVSVLYGRASDDFAVTAQSDTLKPRPVTKKQDGLVWAGVTVDNVPLRGSTGTILTHIDKDLMKNAYLLDDTRLIILQFGGNFVPAAGSSKAISGYMDKVRDQIAWFQEAVPGGKVLFIGPSDMAAWDEEDGRLHTYRRLAEVVDSLKAVTLRCGAAYWDLYGMMGGANSMPQWVRHKPALAGPDYVHFTPAGAKVVGETLSHSLLTYYDFYDLRKTLPSELVEQSMER